MDVARLALTVLPCICRCLQITDTCPCNYPSNAYSNRRWCCGDMYHLDMSTWAFEKVGGRIGRGCTVALRGR